VLKVATGLGVAELKLRMEDDRVDTGVGEALDDATGLEEAVVLEDAGEELATGLGEEELELRTEEDKLATELGEILEVVGTGAGDEMLELCTAEDELEAKLAEALEVVGIGASEEELELCTAAEDELDAELGEALDVVGTGASEEELELRTAEELGEGQDVAVTVLVEVVGCVTCTVWLEVTALPVCVTVTVEAGRGAAVIDATVFEVTKAVCVTMARVGAGPNKAVNGSGLLLPGAAPR
jgi:hypothetical protein